MVKLKNTFIQGKLNLDLDERLVPNGQYVNAENIRVANSESSDIGAIENMLGNRALTTFALGDNPRTIGQVSDVFNDTIYYFVVSDIGSYVLEYNTTTGVQAFVLQDTRVGDANILNFSDDFLITDSRVLIDSDNNRVFLFFTDDLNPVRQVNVSRAKTYAVNGFGQDEISLIKKPPIDPPTIELQDIPGLVSNNIEERFLVFSYRYRYLDEERSALSPFSEVAFRVGTFNYDFSINSNNSMVNAFNKVVITINTGSDLVTGIDVVFKEIDNPTVYLVGSFDKADRGWNDNTNQTIDFINDKSSRVLESQQLLRLFDNVPKRAKSLELIGNRLTLGNYTENYNLVDSSSDPVVVDLTLDSTQTAITSGVGTTTMKSIRDYEAVIVYGDDYGRLTTALESENNSHHIGSANSINQNKLRLNIANNPPSFATFYRIFVKQSRYDYDVITPIVFYQEGAFSWVKIEDSDISKISEGDVVYVKADTRGLLDVVAETKILEITTQERNFLEEDTTGVLQQVAGTYAKVKPVGYQLLEADLETYLWNRLFSNDGFEDYIGININYVQAPTYYGVSGGLNDLTSSGTYVNNVDLRYLVEIDGVQTAATATVTLSSGAAGSVDGITVNGVQIMSGSEAFDTDLDTTATAVVNNINANISAPNYSASSTGAVITITSITLGTGVNGFVVTSTATTLVTADTNMSGAINNTFRWSTDNGATFGAEDVPITAGVPQLLELGVMVTFAADTGHLTTDRWFIGAKSNTSGIGVDQDARVYSIYRGRDTDRINAGARINIVYDEYNDEVQFIEKNYIASTGYANLEEWFIGDDIISDLGIPESRIWFRRGIVVTFAPEIYQLDMTDDGTGTMNMVISSLGFEENNTTPTAIVVVTLEIIQSEDTVLFETKPAEVTDESYYEVSRTYPIVAGFHTSTAAGDVSQTALLDATLILPLYNAYAWGNGFESIKIRDSFNAPRTAITTRPIVAIEDYRENVRIASMTYSQPYEQTTNYNGINEFNLSRANFKDLDDAFGSIQKLWSRDTDLIVFQEDKTHKVLVNKSILFNADGTGNVSQNTNVLGQEIGYAGEYGISKNPESFAIYGNYIWHTDTRRGCVLRLTNNGYFEISDNGMRDYFRDYFRNNISENKFGMYDPYHDQYVLHLDKAVDADSLTLSFDEKVKGWTSFHSFLPDGMVNLNNRFYTIKDGQLYLHNDESADRNTYYGVNYPSKIAVIVNQNPSDIKVVKNISTESSVPLNCTVTSYVNDKSNFRRTTLLDTQFQEDEGYWYSEVFRNELASDTSSKSVYGIGVVTDVTGSDITVNGANSSLGVGDNLFNSVGEAVIGLITAVVGNVITVTITGTVATGDFVYGVKNAKVEGSEMRGYNHRVDLEKTTTERLELYAVNTNVFKSFE